jgi:hypothetical protein
MLVGLLHPTSGDATVFGKNIITDMVSFVFLDESPPPFSLYLLFDDFPCLKLFAHRDKVSGRVVRCIYFWFCGCFAV